MTAFLLTVFVCTASGCDTTPYPMDPAKSVYGSDLQCYMAGQHYNDRVRRETDFELYLDYRCQPITRGAGQ